MKGFMVSGRVSELVEVERWRTAEEGEGRGGELELEEGSWFREIMQWAGGRRVTLQRQTIV